VPQRNLPLITFFSIILHNPEKYQNGAEFSFQTRISSHGLGSSARKSQNFPYCSATLIVLLASHQGLTKSDRRCDHVTWLFSGFWVVFLCE